MMNEQALDQLFEGFVAQGVSSVRDLYSIMPVLSASQQREYLRCRALARKWDLEDVNSWLDEFLEVSKQNRNLGWMPSFKAFLKAVTLDEQIRGVKIQAGQSQ